ncbi:MAG: hypothetical protein ABIG28_00695 [archaeon]
MGNTATDIRKEDYNQLRERTRGGSKHFRNNGPRCLTSKDESLFVREDSYHFKDSVVVVRINEKNDILATFFSVLRGINLEERNEEFKKLIRKEIVNGST